MNTSRVFGETTLTLFEVVTGASRGIGRATAIEFTKHGAIGIVLHFFGDEATTSEITCLENEIRELNPSCKTVTVGGDIALRETSIRIVSEGVKKLGRIGKQSS